MGKRPPGMKADLGRHAAGYSAAVVATAAVVLIRWLLDPVVGNYLPLATLYGAVAFAVWFGGYRPAVLATVLGYLASDYLFIEPRGTLGFQSAHNLVGLVLYLFSCAIIVGFGEALRVTRDRADRERESLRITLTSIGDAVIVTDAHGRVTLMNRVAEELTGWHKEATGRALEDVFRIINEQTRQTVESPVGRVLREGVVVGLANHTTLVAQDGTERPVEDSAAPVRGADGRVAGVVLVFRDAGEQRRALEALRESQRREKERADELETILRAAPMPIWIARDPDGHHITGNPASFAILGLPEGANVSATSLAHDPSQRGFREYRGDKPIPADELPVQRAARGELVNGAEVKFVFDDGRVRYIYGNAVPLRNPDGSARGCVAAFADVTPLKEAEAALRRHQEILNLLWEAASVLLTTDEPDAMLRALFARIGPRLGLDAYLNYMVTEAGDALRLVSFAGIPDETAGHIARREFGEAVSGTVALRRQPVVATDVQQSDDPKARLVQSLGIRAYVCNPLQVRQDLLGTLLFASRSRDAFAEDDLDFLRTVCHYVAVAYERAGLVRELRDADRRKDEFLATLAHELRNPLAPMRNAVELLRRAAGDAAVEERARSVLGRQLDQMVHLVDDLLDMSRISQGKVQLRRERVELAAVVRSALEVVRPLLEAQGHALTVTLPPDAVYLDADPTRLTQVVSNLLNNAAKYTERGGRVWLTASRVGGTAVVSVRDTGIGIAAEHLPHLFEMFSQVTPALERSQGGLGIGLSLVRGLVELHGGTVEARSEGAGRGSEFIVRLPVVDSPAAAGEHPGAGGARPGTVPGLRILVVDDNRDAADSLALVLALAGHETRTAFDGPGAVRAATEFRPHAVLLDIGLPGMNGYEAARQIRNQPGGKDLALIALTGWGQDEDKRRAAAAGFDHHLTKPVEAAALEELLAQITPAPPP